MADCAVRGGAERSAVRVVPNGIGAEDIGATNLSPRPAESFMRGGTLRLLYVGSLWNVKGVDVLIRSVAALARSRGDASVQLDLVGNGPSESLLRKLVASLAMKDVVRFPGRIPRQQLAAIYAGADVLCTPSLSEAFSIVTLEAMLCGLPVVGSNTGGIPMLVDDGQSGHLAIAGDVGSLAQCLTAVSASREHLATLGARGFAKVRRQFSWDIITVELDRLAAEVAPVRARQEPQ
jgi:glycosyltransferase involved in cell wall biosynthesis